jgi:protein-S-isoprenylcysteine O-methyltransferase Ste14
VFDLSHFQWSLWNRWDLVVVSAVVHVFVLAVFVGSAFMKPKKGFVKGNGILIAFIVALYLEMYGIPLTIFLLQPILTEVFAGSIYPSSFSLRIIGSILILIGFLLIYFGWREIYHNKEQRLVKWGIYTYIRHPQYLGIALLTLGQLIQWPTLLGLILWPGILLIYYKLSRSEENELFESFGEEFVAFKKEVPGYFPKINFKLQRVQKEKAL